MLRETQTSTVALKTTSGDAPPLRRSRTSPTAATHAVQNTRDFSSLHRDSWTPNRKTSSSDNAKENENVIEKILTKAGLQNEKKIK